MSRIHSRLALAVSTAAIAALALSGCASSDPISGGSETSAAPASDTIVIGSQAYYSNEIIAEIYAQALENAGFDVSRDAFNSGQRDAYIPALEAGGLKYQAQEANRNDSTRIRPAGTRSSPGG